MKRAFPLVLIMAIGLALPQGASAQLDLDGATSLSISGFLFGTTTENSSYSLNGTFGLNQFVGGGRANLARAGFAFDLCVF